MTAAHYYLARLTLQNDTPLSIASNGADGVFDIKLVRDANNLPAIPATSIAGVLRHLYGKDADDLFGHQDKNTGKSSDLQISWAHLQNSKGQCWHGLALDTQALQTDPLWKLALQTDDTPVKRDRVRINHQGVVDSTGKFDRSVLPAGFRFSLEISLWSTQANDERWHTLLGLLRHPLFRLGGNTRSGLGKMRLISLHTGTFDLKQPHDRQRFSQLSNRLDDVTGLEETSNQLQTHTSAKLITATITLKPTGFWRIGQGTISHLQANNKEADQLPKTEVRIDWHNNSPRILSGNHEHLLIPASSIKGALAHRIAFHYNRLHGIWAEDMLSSTQAPAANPLINQLFGFTKDDAAQNESKGQAGRIYIDDTFIPLPDTSSHMGIQMHNSIDRFSAGVREHMLYSEELLWHSPHPIQLTLTINTEQLSLNTEQKKAIALALADLCTERLPLGAGANKGHGLFQGSITWSDNGQWIEGNNA